MAKYERLTANVKKVSAGGTSYHADCPYCGKSKVLGSELSIRWAVCYICSRPFDLAQDEAETQSEDETSDDDETTGDDKPYTRKQPVPRYEDVDVVHGPRSWPIRYGSR